MEEIKPGYARITEVLSILNDYSNVPQEILEAKQIVGTNVHAAIESIVKGESPIVNNAKEWGYVKSFMHWRDQANPSFITTEQRYYDDSKMITGQIDAIVKLHGIEEGVLVDYKTSAQENSKVWPYQAHLYHYLLSQNNICNLSHKFIFLRLRPAKLLTPWEVEEELQHWQYFPPFVHEYNYSQSSMDYALSLVDFYWEERKKLQEYQ